MTRLGILTTHPIQYQVPWFRSLARTPNLDITVFYCMIPDERQQGEGFGLSFQWDVPLLEGYPYKVLDNFSKRPSLECFLGCDTPAINRLVLEGGYDAFIVNGWVVKSCLQLLWACCLYRVPCIVRGESNSLRPRTYCKTLVHRMLLSRYGAFLYIGEGNRRFYLGNGVPEEKLFYAPYCVDNERFAMAANSFLEHRHEIRTAWGLPNDAVVFIFCAKFVHKKRPMDVLRALTEVTVGADSPLPVYLLMVGTGELLDACKVYVKDLGLPVTFAGFLNQSEITRAYIAADCQILPSDDGETWGLVINEGMACGLPAIVSDQVGCHLDLITPSETGEVYPMGDVAALAQKMRALATDPQRLAAMGHAARERIAGYNYDRVVQGTLAALCYLGLYG